MYMYILKSYEINQEFYVCYKLSISKPKLVLKVLYTVLQVLDLVIENYHLAKSEKKIILQSLHVIVCGIQCAQHVLLYCIFFGKGMRCAEIHCCYVLKLTFVPCYDSIVPKVVHCHSDAIVMFSINILFITLVDIKILCFSKTVTC